MTEGRRLTLLTMGNGSPDSTVASGVSADAEGHQHVGYFLRSVASNLSASSSLQEPSRGLEGVTHYRLLPGVFPNGMDYHFDGLATVLKFSFANGRLEYSAKAYASDAFADFGACIFAGTGTGPTLGRHPCLKNPGVNLLPIDGQLWLTIDTAEWGRVDPDTLDTLPSKVQVPSTVLNAHPACDRSTGECFVQYNCAKSKAPLTNQACIGLLKPQHGDKDMLVEEVSRAGLPKSMLIQHSHSPCVTPNYVVSKLDAFTPRAPINKNKGMLKVLHQAEENLFMVMDRQTRRSRIMTSNFSFVNNHFWNCYETPEAEVVIDTVAATEDYLDNYFRWNLDKPHAEWDHIFHPPMRCYVRTGVDSVSCESFFQGGAEVSIFDYPTFNPLFKMRPDYRFFYAIAAASPTSRWFDQLIKVDVESRAVIQRWSAPGVFLTEADFIPSLERQGSGSAPEDEGKLVSVLYNATNDASSLAVFDARTLRLVDQYALDFVVPFHAHGIVCMPGQACYTNP